MSGLGWIHKCLKLIAFLIIPKSKILIRTNKMTAWHTPHASILFACFIKTHPYATNAQRICNQEGAILMGWHFTTDLWILEYVHRLHNRWLFEKHNLTAECLDNIRIGEAFKSWMKVVHSMPYLVEGFIFGNDQITVLIFSFFLEEWFDLPSTF